MTTRIAYTPAARDDLREIGDYIGYNNPARAQSFVQELRDHCRRMAKHPRRQGFAKSLEQGCAAWCMALTLSSTRPAMTV